MLDNPAVSALTIHRRELGRTLVLALEGNASLACMDQLEAALTDAAAMQPQHVLIDLTQLDAIADLVNGTLSLFAKTIRDRGGSVRFVVQSDRRSA